MALLETYMAGELPRIHSFIEKEIDALGPFTGEIVGHAMLNGGKRLRPLLTILFARAYGHVGEGVYPLAGALEFLHSATLLHDDILDDADMRRGSRAAHVVFGSRKTILAGDALFALANRIISQYGIPRLVDCLARAIIETADGEILEIENMRNANLSRSTYLEIITGKTACLIRAACECGPILAGASPEQVSAAARFGLNLGIAFQLTDDALDYSPDSRNTGKRHGNDLAEGKLTLPLIYYLETLNPEERGCLDANIRDNRLDASDIRRIIGAVIQEGCIEKTRSLAKTYAGDAARNLTPVPEGPEKRVMEEILAHVVERDR